MVLREHGLDALPRLGHLLELFLGDHAHRDDGAFGPLCAGRIVVFDAGEHLDDVARLEAVAGHGMRDRLVQPPRRTRRQGTSTGNERESFRLRNSCSREMPQSSSAESITGNTALGVASDMAGGWRSGHKRPLVGQQRDVAQNVWSDFWPASSITQHSNFPSPAISNRPTTSELPALGGPHRDDRGIGDWRLGIGGGGLEIR